jgi:hypothetical protein
VQLSRQNGEAVLGELIKKVWEVDPLECPRCGREMKMIALTDESEVVEKILRHLGLWTANALSVRACPEPCREGSGSRAPLEPVIRGYIHEPLFDDMPLEAAQ